MNQQVANAFLFLFQCWVYFNWHAEVVATTIEQYEYFSKRRSWIACEINKNRCLRRVVPELVNAFNHKQDTFLPIQGWLYSYRLYVECLYRLKQYRCPVYCREYVDTQKIIDACYHTLLYDDKWETVDLSLAFAELSCHGPV